ncbi:cache domain-containing protein [Paenibacillus sp. P26]|nr:cache domain-containing protein [Paenibacillus sp. P26]
MKPHAPRWLNWLMPPLRGIVAARYWLMAYVLLILLPVSLLLYSYYQKSAAILEQEVTRSMLQTLRQTGINLQYQMDRVRDTSNALFMNPYLYKYVMGPDTDDPFDTVKGLRSLIGAAESNDNVFRIRLFVEDTKLYAGEKINFFPLANLKARSWYPRIVEAGGSMVWTGAYKESYIDKGDAYVLSSARMLRDPDRYDRMIGVLVVDMTEQTLRDIIGRVELSEQKLLYITDREGKLIWHTDKAMIGQPAPLVDEAAASEEEGAVKFAHGKDTAYRIFTTIPSTGWKLTAEVPAAEITRQAFTLNRFSGAPRCSACPFCSCCSSLC